MTTTALGVAFVDALNVVAIVLATIPHPLVSAEGVKTALAEFNGTCRARIDVIFSRYFAAVLWVCYLKNNPISSPGVNPRTNKSDG